jgi:hypothetical protein
MVDLSENCPACLLKLKEHSVQNFRDCIMKLFDKMENNRLDGNYSKVSAEKNKEALRVINDLLKLTRSILVECDKDPDANDLAIKYLLNQKQLLTKLRDTLF